MAGFHAEIIELLRKRSIAIGKPYTYQEEFTWVAANIHHSFSTVITYLKVMVDKMDSSSLRTQLVEHERTLAKNEDQGNATAFYTKSMKKSGKAMNNNSSEKGGYAKRNVIIATNLDILQLTVGICTKRSALRTRESQAIMLSQMQYHSQLCHLPLMWP